MKKQIWSVLFAAAAVLAILSANASAADASEIVYFELPAIDPCHPPMDSSAFGDSANAVQTVDSEYTAKCIDRLNLPQFAKDFYTLLEAESKPLSSSALGRDGLLIDPSGAAALTFDDGSAAYVMPVSYPEEAELWEDEILFADLGEFAANCIYAAFYAFDRDHPEVFWLDGYYAYNDVDNRVFNVILAARNPKAPEQENWDIRAEGYRDAGKIKAAITALNESVAAITAEADQKATNGEKIAYFNEWLTTHNQYNYIAIYDSSNESMEYDDIAHKSLGALTTADLQPGGGRTGINGPVCEGYARAMQLLCQQVDIPCVLADGNGHMWNCVKPDPEDPRWYAVDAAWNDPVPFEETDTPAPEEYAARTANSGSETTAYTLVGADTVVSSGQTETFRDRHPEENTVASASHVFIPPDMESELKMVPELNRLAYVDSISVSGLDVPANGAEADTTVTLLSEPKSGHHPMEAGDTDIFTEPAVTWSPAPADGKFIAGTAYTAAITYVPLRNGYGLTPDDASKIALPAGAESVTVDESGTIHVRFPETGPKKSQIILAEDMVCTYGDAGMEISASADCGTLTYAVTAGNDVVSIDDSGCISIKKAGTAVVTITSAETDIYAETTKQVMVTVNPKVLTPSINTPGTVTKVYDGGTAVNGDLSIALDGSRPGDDVTASAVYTYDSADVGTGKTIIASNIVLGGDQKDNYTLSAKTCTVIAGTITKSAPTLAFNAAYAPDKVYDREVIGDPVFTDLIITGASFSDVTFTWSEPPQDAGTYTLTARIEETPNTNAASAEKLVTIVPKTVADPLIALSADTFEYDGTAKEPVVTVKDGDVTIPEHEYAAAYSDNTNVGTAVVTVAGNADGNYILNAAKTYTITQAVLMDSDVTVAGNFTYNGTEQTPAVTVVKNGEILSENTDYMISYAPDCINAGTVTVTVAGAGNYGGTITQTYTIAKASVTVAAENKTAVQGAAMPELTWTGSLLGSDTWIEPPRVHCAVDNTNTAGSFPIIVSGADAGDNYDIICADGILDIIPDGLADSSADGDDLPKLPLVVPVSDGQISLQVSVSGYSAAVHSIDTSRLSSITGDLTLDFTSLDKSVYLVRLPADSIREIADAAQSQDNGLTGLSVKLTAGEISFDANALASLCAQAGSQVTVTISPVNITDLNARQREIVGNAPIFDLSVQSVGKPITDFSDGSATIALPYTLRSGEAPSGIEANYLDSTGSTRAYATAYDAQTETAVFTTSNLSLYFIDYNAPDSTPAEAPAAQEIPFADIEDGQWYFDAVQYVFEKGMMTGMTPTDFCPDVTTNRGMIVTMLYRLEGEPAAGPAGFADVPDGEWYADAVAWAEANNIVSGISRTSFAPLAPITRQQMAAILYRYAGYKGYDTGGSASLSGYTDILQIEAYAVPAMQWANAEGLITGTSPATLDPAGDATRAQVAAILMRFCENILK